MEPEKFKAASPEDWELYERWLRNGGKKDANQLEMEKMLERYGNVEFANPEEKLNDLEKRLRGEGWERCGIINLVMNTNLNNIDQPDYYKETAIPEIGNPNYRIVIFNHDTVWIGKKDRSADTAIEEARSADRSISESDKEFIAEKMNAGWKLVDILKNKAAVSYEAPPGKEISIEARGNRWFVLERDSGTPRSDSSESA